MNRVNVPKLRFPGFDGEWEEKKILDFAPLQRGFDLPVIEIKEGKYPVVFSNGILKTHNKFKAKAPGVVTGRSGTIGKITFVEEDYWPHNTSLWVTDFKNNEPKYVYFFFSNFKLERLGTGSGVPTLNRNDIHAKKAFFPTLPEQQKIASFLSAVDEKIQQLSRKKELLEQYKKGVMQQLFSGKLRFKDENGKEYPDWEEKKLGEVGKIVTGKTPSTNDSNLWDGEIQFITPTDIKDDIKYQENTARYVKSSDKIKILPINSIIYTCIASIGKMCISKYPSITNQQINSLIVNEFNNFEYVYYWLFYLTPYIKTTQANTTLPIINKTDFSKFHISIPSLPEQQKIANFLSSIDAKIENTKDELEKIQLFKKGLLQKMFV